MLAKNTVSLWYDKDALEAAQFYAATFPDSAVTAVNISPGEFPGAHPGEVLTVEFTVLGIPCLGINGGPMFTHNEAFSFLVTTDSQEETDRYWDALVGNGGSAGQCGWCKDRWGVWWQIQPRFIFELFAVGGEEARRVFEAMGTMSKLDIAALEAARRG